MINNILVGIRLSKQSPVVFQYALRLAQQFGAKLTIAYILQERIEDLTGRPRADRKLALEKFREDQQKRLDTFVKTQYSKQAHRIPIELIVKYDYTYEAFCRIAEQENMNLIVIGKFTKSVNITDTNNYLVSNAPCPLLVIPEDVIYTPLRRMVYASNFILEDCAAVLKLKYWLDIFHGELICLNVCNTQAEKQATQYRLELLEELFPQENISFRMIVADLDKGIARYAKLTDAGMVATMHRPRKKLWGGFFKRSIAKATTGESDVPMLIF